jgi:pilin isopeptide linkage protein/LPXTG-motif cell wall-anchored protein
MNRTISDLPKRIAAVMLSVAMIFTYAVSTASPVRAGTGASMTMTVSDSDGNQVESGSGITPSDFRGKNGTVKIEVKITSSEKNNEVLLTLPRWFKWNGVSGGSEYTAETSSTDGGTDNALTVKFTDLDTQGEKTLDLDFNYVLNEASMTDDTISSLENGGLSDMVFSGKMTNSAGTVNESSVTAAYAWEDIPQPTVNNVGIGLIGNLVSWTYMQGVYLNYGNSVKTGINDDINKNSNTLANVSIAAADPYKYGAAVDSIQIKLKDSVKNIYKINGIVKGDPGSKKISIFDDYDAVVSDDGCTLTLTRKDGVSGADFSDLDKSRLVGNIDLGFRLKDGGEYDRDSWDDNISSGKALFESGSTQDLLDVSVNYKKFTSSASGATDTKTSTLQGQVVPYENVDPKVTQTSGNTTIYDTNFKKYGEAKITVASYGDPGDRDNDTWIGETMINRITGDKEKVSVPEDASGYSLVTDYPYEVRGMEYEIRPKYEVAESTLDDKFKPGSYELEKVVFTLSDGTTKEVSASSEQFGSKWTAAAADNGTFKVTASDLGIDEDFTRDNEKTVKYVTKVTQVFKSAEPGFLPGAGTCWTFRLTKWDMTYYEDDGTTVLGTGSVTHTTRDGGTVVEENGKRWYAIKSTLKDKSGNEVSSSEHSIQVGTSYCPTFTLSNSTDGSRGNLFHGNDGWKLNSDNQVGKLLDIRMPNGTDLNKTIGTLKNPTIGFYKYWMDNMYTWTGKMDVTPAMAGWTVTYGVQTYRDEKEEKPVEVRKMTLPSKEDFNDPSKTNEDGTITIDLLPKTNGNEEGDSWEHFAASPEVGQYTRYIASEDKVYTYDMYIRFDYNGDWDVKSVLGSGSDGVVGASDGYMIRNIESCARTKDYAGNYENYLWWDGGHIIKMAYQWDNCTENSTPHLRNIDNEKKDNHFGTCLAGCTEQLGADTIVPVTLKSVWNGTLSQGQKSTISGKLTLSSRNVGSPEWKPSGDVLYLEMPDNKIIFTGNAKIDGVEDLDAYVTTIKGKRYLVIHNKADKDSVKTNKIAKKDNRWFGYNDAEYEPMTVEFDVFTMPTASSSSATEVIGDDSYLDFSGNQVYESSGGHRTAIQNMGGLNWNGWRDYGKAVDDPLDLYDTSSDLTQHFWAIKTNGLSLTPAIRATLGLGSYSGMNYSSDDDPTELQSTVGNQVVPENDTDKMESLVTLGAGDNPIRDAEIIVEIPQKGVTHTSGDGNSYTNDTSFVLRSAPKQYDSTATGDQKMVFYGSEDGENWVPADEVSDWSKIRFVKATIKEVSSKTVQAFTLAFDAPDGKDGDNAHLYAKARYTENGTEKTTELSPESISTYTIGSGGTAELPDITKNITGNTPSGAETFEFTIAAGSDDTPLPNGSTGGSYNVSVNGAGTVSPGEVVFTEPGTYSYTITEKNTGAENYTYDTSTYTVTYKVTEENGRLNAERTITKGTDTVGAVTFSNEYKGTGEPENPTTPSDPSVTAGDPPVKKVITGDKPKTDSTFEFTLAADRVHSTLPSGMTSMPMPAAAGTEQSMTTTITGEGSSEFGDITFTAPGTYVYNITEKNTGVAGYTYDDSIYQITYVVSEGEDGKLNCVRTIRKNGEVVTGAEFAFTNSYKTDSGDDSTDTDDPTNPDDSDPTIPDDSGNHSSDKGGNSGTGSNGAGSNGSSRGPWGLFPKTGDSMTLYIGGIAFLCAGAAAVYLKRRRKENR